MAVAGRGTPLPVAMPSRLVIAGPYRFVRNPMAMAGIVQGIAIGILLSSWVVIAYAVIGSVIWNLAVRPHEEADLDQRFGADFRRYRDAVRCWIPRLRPGSAREASRAQTGDMTTTNLYQPGVCNIGPAEIRRAPHGMDRARRGGGVPALAFALIFPRCSGCWWPAGRHGRDRISAGRVPLLRRFGTQGLFNFGEMGAEEQVHEAEYRRKDQRKAILITVLSLLITVVVAVGAFLAPIR